MATHLRIVWGKDTLRPGYEEHPFCGRVTSFASCVLVERRPEPADYRDAADGVTCKWCLRRLGLAPRITAHGARDAKVEQRTANAIADWLERTSRGGDAPEWNGPALARDIRAGLWRKKAKE